MTNCTCDRFYQVRMADEVFFPLQLLQLEEAAPSTAPCRDQYRGGLYAYLEAEKMRYMEAKSATTSTSMGSECYV
ncbi:hypothetical protein TNIN_59651 [Trichonephila inaurata madagascariensis]|uniref:Uncharacterized protein n=1 Tax=Trichonephila inaurata madagascariensis TaxID=2747483 RepID=A0A8X6MLC7_9ARAC|nr:hypothetical protein TNIN_59651 [Trichonephila inaurata madagascariensis]